MEGKENESYDEVVTEYKREYLELLKSGRDVPKSVSYDYFRAYTNRLEAAHKRELDAAYKKGIANGMPRQNKDRFKTDIEAFDTFCKENCVKPSLSLSRQYEEWLFKYCEDKKEEK